MKLSAEQQAGVRVNEACDKCGQVLGWVRFTCKDEPGEWCSRQCRDGVEAHAPGTMVGREGHTMSMKDVVLSLKFPPNTLSG